MMKIIKKIRNIIMTLINYIISLFSRKMHIEHLDNKKKAYDKLQKLSMNCLYVYTLKDKNLDEYTEDGLYELQNKCDLVTKQVKIKVGNCKKNKLYRDIMDSINVNKLDESELEQVYLKLVKKSEEIRLKLKQKELNGPVNEFNITL